MTQQYTEQDIKIYKGLEGIRKNIGMYIGGANYYGLHQLIFEIVANAFDEFSAGYGSLITISINKDNSITITDEGRGIPVGIHPEEKKSTLELLMTTLHSGGKFNAGSNNPYKSSGGMHGLGAAVVNALSTVMQITVWREGFEHFIEFRDGIPQGPVQQTRSIAKKKTGTSIKFLPSISIFKDIKFDWDYIFKYLQELCFLNKIAVSFNSEIDNKSHKFPKENTICDYVDYINSDDKTINKIINFNEESDDPSNKLYVDIALNWRSSTDKERIFCFTNNIRQKEGGEHLAGFKMGLTKAIIKYISNKIGSKKTENIKGEDIRENITCVLSLKMTRPEFSSQTKDKLVSDNIRSFISQTTNEKIYDFLQENPHEAKIIMDKVLLSMNAREAAQKAKNTTKRKDPLDIGITLPGKLSDCSEKDASVCELFIVEGNSAGGTAKQGRNRKTQAILPLRGKIVNTYEHSLPKAIAFEQVSNLITALGCGIGTSLNLEKIRYHKIIIMTDADIDGAHIRTLLLTFFYRFMPEVIHNGYLYIAQPPLYKIKKGTKEKYILDDNALNEELLEMIKHDYNEDKIAIFNNISKLYNTISCFTKIEQKHIIKLILDKHINSENLKYFESNEQFHINDKIYIKNNFFYYKIYDNEQYSINHNLYKQICEIINQHKLRENNYFEEFDKALNTIKKNIEIQRYKGLGEMNASQLAQSTLEPNSRHILQVTIQDAESTAKTFETFMGDDPSKRKHEIMTKAYTQRDNDF